MKKKIQRKLIKKLQCLKHRSKINKTNLLMNRVFLKKHKFFIKVLYQNYKALMQN